MPGVGMVVVVAAAVALGMAAVFCDQDQHVAAVVGRGGGEGVEDDVGGDLQAGHGAGIEDRCRVEAGGRQTAVLVVGAAVAVVEIPVAAVEVDQADGSAAVVVGLVPQGTSAEGRGRGGAGDPWVPADGVGQGVGHP